MRAENSLPSEAGDVYKVLQWKHDIDPSEPRWKHVFFRYVFLKFLDFSFWLGIPAVKEVVVESDQQGNVRRIYRWCEDQGIFASPEQAEAGCLTERWGYTKLPYGRLAPSESSYYGGTVYPKKKNPRRWTKPTLSLILKDRVEEERTQQTLKQYLAELNHVLDR